MRWFVFIGCIIFCFACNQEKQTTTIVDATFLIENYLDTARLCDGCKIYEHPSRNRNGDLIPEELSHYSFLTDTIDSYSISLKPLMDKKWSFDDSLSISYEEALPFVRGWNKEDMAFVRAALKFSRTKKEQLFEEKIGQGLIELSEIQFSQDSNACYLIELFTSGDFSCGMEYVRVIGWEKLDDKWELVSDKIF